jgi:DNA (cytosine-5)-methyltransferase 1
MRPAQPREAARLMGLPDAYVLPRDPIDALSLMGDGVVAPVRFLAERVIESLLDGEEAALPAAERFDLFARGGASAP